MSSRQIDHASPTIAERADALNIGEDARAIETNTAHNSGFAGEMAGGSNSKSSTAQRVVKRCFDMLVTLALLPLIIPVALAIALAIRFDSGGPVLFWQERIGRGNQRFRIVKFRTMNAEIPEHDASSGTARKDPRVTRFGAFLRQTSLDELPQFYNVLKGEMSVVGPRPHTQETAVGDRLLWEIDPNYLDRHVVKPGITGLAQVRGHRGSLFNEDQFQARLDADLEYIEQWSLIDDLKIIFRTAGILVHHNAF